MILRLVLTFFAFAVVGCTSVLPPVVTVTGARVLEVSDVGARLAIHLELANPNDYPLPLERVSYRVSLQKGAIEPYVADDLPARTIAAHGTQTLHLPAALASGSRTFNPEWLEHWQVKGTLTYAPDRGLRAFLTETGVPLPFVGFNGDAASIETPSQ
ncbi:MAG: LEA type 2 family protein [Algisphaera sp.]